MCTNGFSEKGGNIQVEIYRGLYVLSISVLTRVKFLGAPKCLNKCQNVISRVKKGEKSWFNFIALLFLGDKEIETASMCSTKLIYCFSVFATRPQESGKIIAASAKQFATCQTVLCLLQSQSSPRAII